MSHKLQPVRGTHDLLPEASGRHRFVTGTMARVAGYYNYGEIITPTFEFSEVFHRTLGDTSDVVTKETYTFTDRGGESITLRPEFTASVVRAFLSNSQQDHLPFKVYYQGPAFRYERPQKGRQREFYQFGAECLGVAEPVADVEMIAMAMQMFWQMQIHDKVTLELNSLGDADSRKAYRAALVAYFQDHRASLSEDSKTRLEKNPLRILDSKDEGDRKLIAGAPGAKDYFTVEANDFFVYVKEALAGLGIAYKENPRLVRGLDYYNHTVFEFTTELLGAQGTVLAGGRYDGLVKQMGGPDIAGVGFAAGIERLVGLIEAAGTKTPVWQSRSIAVIPVDDAQEQVALKLAQRLRQQSYAAELISRGNMGKKMKKADKLGAPLALLIGEDEMKSATVTVKNLGTGGQETMDYQKLDRMLQSIRHKVLSGIES
jgi:histidyl-tRNA synthetase